MLLAYQLDKRVRGSRLYQSIFYIPVVIAPAIIGLISELVLSPQQGLISSLFADPRHGDVIDWLGDPSVSLLAVLVFACWRHASYVMILYLAGGRSTRRFARLRRSMARARCRRSSGSSCPR